MVLPCDIIDFHSHILPRLDHGCDNLDECIRQLALIQENGTNISVATPHFYPHQHNIEQFVKDVDMAIDRMQAAGITQAPSIAIGAEVLLCRNIHHMADFEMLCIRGTRTLLLELPLKPLTDEHFATVEQIMDGGYTVLLAHIDRYLADFEDHIDTLLSMGALAQVNAVSLSSRATRKKIFGYLEDSDNICAIGSDLHGVDTGAYKKFVKAQKVLKDHYTAVMQRSANLLEGAELLKL